MDTTAAQSGIYRIAAYTSPSHATTWQVGGLWSDNGTIKPDKNYQRTVKSVYLAEKHPSADNYLAVGTDQGTWSNLMPTVHAVVKTNAPALL